MHEPLYVTGTRPGPIDFPESLIVRKWSQIFSVISFVTSPLTKEAFNLPIKVTAEHFNRDPVVISRGINGMEKRIREDEAFAAAKAMLRESLEKIESQYSFG